MTTNETAGHTTHLAEHHLAALAASGITPEHAALRGYETVTSQSRLVELNFATSRQQVPGLLVPGHRKDRSVAGYQNRADNPKADGPKYVSPLRQRNYIDVPVGTGPMVDDLSQPLFITEGAKKSDCAALRGLCCISLNGVYGWKGTNAQGSKTALGDWAEIPVEGRRVIIAFDGDVARKKAVRKALQALATYLTHRGAHVEYLHLPDTDNKTGLDDFLVANTVQDLRALVKPDMPPESEPQPEQSDLFTPEPSPVTPITLRQADTVFTNWLGDDYDLDSLHAVIAAAAVERIDGDPLWLLLVSGSGNAKTETVQPLSAIGAILVSAISSEAALLSGTSKRSRKPTPAED